MKPLDFLMEVCHAAENDNINYKPYEYGNLVQSVPMRKAVEMVERDIKEPVPKVLKIQPKGAIL